MQSANVREHRMHLTKHTANQIKLKEEAASLCLP